MRTCCIVDLYVTDLHTPRGRRVGHNATVRASVFDPSATGDAASGAARVGQDTLSAPARSHLVAELVVQARQPVEALGVREQVPGTPQLHGPDPLKHDGDSSRSNQGLLPSGW